MKSSKPFVIALLVVLVIAVVLFFGARQGKPPVLTLTTVRHAHENEMPVVVFRVEVSDNRRIEIRQVEQKFQGISQIPNWGSQGGPMGRAFRRRREFVVAAPTNSCVWQLEVGVAVDESNVFRRLKQMAMMEWMSWKVTRRFDRTPKMIWTAFFPVGWTVLRSEPITNAVPQVR